MSLAAELLDEAKHLASLQDQLEAAPLPKDFRPKTEEELIGSIIDYLDDESCFD